MPTSQASPIHPSCTSPSHHTSSQSQPNRPSFEHRSPRDTFLSKRRPIHPPHHKRKDEQTSLVAHRMSLSKKHKTYQHDTSQNTITPTSPPSNPYASFIDIPEQVSLNHKPLIPNGYKKRNATVVTVTKTKKVGAPTNATKICIAGIEQPRINSSFTSLSH